MHKINLTMTLTVASIAGLAGLALTASAEAGGTQTAAPPTTFLRALLATLSVAVGWVLLVAVFVVAVAVVRGRRWMFGPAGDVRPHHRDHADRAAPLDPEEWASPLGAPGRGGSC
jgi:hypothetical protein